MLLVLCVDLDDDLGRKTGRQTPVVGRDAVERAAVALATADPEDSDVNVLFEGLHLYDTIDDEAVEVAVVTGSDGSDVAANRTVGEEVDTVLAGLSTGEDVRALVVTDGAQDESVLPVIRSRVPIDGVRRVVVRQAQDLESIYYTMKQVLDDPETRGTVLVPLGILLLIYPLLIVAEALNLPGASLGVVSGLLGLYLLFRGFGLERALDAAVERARAGLFSGRMSLVTSVVAAALLVIGAVGGLESLERFSAATPALGPLGAVAAVAYGAVQWVAAAGVTASLGRVTDEYLHDSFRWRYLNAPFYVLAIAAVLHGLSGYFLDIQGALTVRALGLEGLSYLAATLVVGTLLGLGSTLLFAVVESRFPREPRTAA
jgi:putative membrane protein